MPCPSERRTHSLYFTFKLRIADINSTEFTLAGRQQCLVTNPCSKEDLIQFGTN